MLVQDKIRILESLKDHINFSYDAGCYIDEEDYHDQISKIDKQIKLLSNNMIDEREIYSYKGPIYKYGMYVGESEYIETTAPSINKARSNIIFRIKKKLH